MTKVLFAGCSHTAHSGFNSENFKEFHYSSILKKQFNWDVVNIAEAGMPNLEIFKRTTSAITIDKYDLVIIQWSGLHRLWVYKKDNNIDTPSKVNEIATSYIKDIFKIKTSYLDNDYVAISELLLYIISLQNTCKMHNIPFIMINGFNSFLKEVKEYTYSDKNFQNINGTLRNMIDFGVDTSEAEVIEKLNILSELYLEVDQSSFIDFGDFSMIGNCLDRSDDKRHPGKKSHKLYAEKIKEKIIELKIENNNKI